MCNTTLDFLDDYLEEPGMRKGRWYHTCVRKVDDSPSGIGVVKVIQTSTAEKASSSTAQTQIILRAYNFER
jgi:hypothetical protein